jgi:hypothetical protein
VARLLPTNRALAVFVLFGLSFGRLVSNLVLALMNFLTMFPNKSPNTLENNLRNSSVAYDSGELPVSEAHANSTYNSIRGNSMSKTPTEELEVVTMRLPSPLLDRARNDAEERGRPFAHSIRAALEIFFFHNVAREMAQTMTEDMKELGLTREDYFRSLLDARYRHLITKQALAEAKKGPAKRG